MYHDVTAMSINSDLFAQLDLSTKFEKLNDENTAILWQYLEELSDIAYSATRRKPPRVPCSAEISNDISKRKGTAQKKSLPTLQVGFDDMWKKLCDMRGCIEKVATSDVLSKLDRLSQTKVQDVWLSNLCANHSEQAFAEIVKTFPFFDDSRTFNDEEWSLFEKCMSVSAMHNNIPQPMMQGIEQVANKLVEDIHNGKTDLASLNMEAIGQQVLSNVSQADMLEFTKNMDKIIPAMQRC
jgi:hypothetical protein